MSIYDQREKSAYSQFEIEPQYARNDHILKWWTPDHDELMAHQIFLMQWAWYWHVTEEILKNTPSEQIEDWKKEDPLCSKYAWYNILMYFAASRAEQLGLTKAIRKPEWKTCPLCRLRFVEDSLPMPLIERLGIDNLDYCAPCLSNTILQGSGDNSAAEENILVYLQELAELLGFVPTQDFGEGINDLIEIEKTKRLALLRLFQNKPTAKRVKEVFGSWLNALIKSGILADGTRLTARGIQTIAKDGHVCLSLGEKTIDDFLFDNGIKHEKEPHYPEGGLRGDFRVGDIIIEYFGLSGDAEYDAKTKKKIEICKKHHIIIIAVYPKDLINRDKLKAKLVPIS